MKRQNHLVMAMFLALLCMCGDIADDDSTTSSDTDTDTDTGTDDSSSSTLQATLSSIQENIFTPSCAVSGCHSSSSSSGGLSLTAGESFSELVGVASSGADMNRVTASNANESYLLFKLEGTQATVGGSGSSMPKGGTALTEAQVDVIVEWIEGGALND